MPTYVATVTLTRQRLWPVRSARSILVRIHSESFNDARALAQVQTELAMRMAGEKKLHAEVTDLWRI